MHSGKVTYTISVRFPFENRYMVETKEFQELTQRPYPITISVTYYIDGEDYQHIYFHKIGEVYYKTVGMKDRSGRTNQISSNDYTYTYQEVRNDIFKGIRATKATEDTMPTIGGRNKCTQRNKRNKRTQRNKRNKCKTRRNKRRN